MHHRNPDQQIISSPVFWTYHAVTGVALFQLAGGVPSIRTVALSWTGPCVSRMLPC